MQEVFSSCYQRNVGSSIFKAQFTLWARSLAICCFTFLHFKMSFELLNFTEVNY